MTDKIFATFLLFSIEAIIFGFLTFLLWIYYRGFGRKYVHLWMLSLLMLSLHQITKALQLYFIDYSVTSQIQLFLEWFKQTSHFLHLSLLLLGVYCAVKRDELPKKFIGIWVFFAVAAGLITSLFYGYNEAAVFNRFYLRDSLPAFIFGCVFLTTGFFLSTTEKLHFSGKVLMIYSFIIGLRYTLFSFLSILILTEDWFSQLMNFAFFFDAGSNVILGFIMLVWMQGAERNLALLAMNRARYLGKHDSLTGVLNRDKVLNELPVFMKQALNKKQNLVVFHLDIKRFKFINDSYGLKVGDLVLGEIARRLSKSILMPKIVGRLWGDSFIFVIELFDEKQQERAAEHIHGLVGSPYQIQHQEVYLQCNVGYCIYPKDGSTAENLMKQANLALFHAKTNKLSSVQYKEGMQSQGRRLVEVERDIIRALNDNEFILYFQPQLNLITNRLEGVEALIRWQHPDKGLLLPVEFLDDVESLGLSSEIDNYVLDKACQTIASWFEKYQRRIPIAVNITAIEFQDPKFVAKIQGLLFKYDIPPTCLELEITENVVMTEVAIAMDTIVVLQNMGIKVSIDDFGTGYSSLAYLREIPFDKIKIDRSFIKEVASNDSDLTIVKSMIELSHALGKRVLAEGVETIEQLQLLRNLNCDAVQGFFISKPLPEDKLQNILIRK